MATTHFKQAAYVYFNREALTKQTMNELDIQKALVKDFIAFFPALLNKSKKAINQLDRASIRHFMHQMKASIALFNGIHLYNEISVLENTISDMNDREIMLKGHAILQKSELLYSEIVKFQNENK
jgi:hypothetical protein